MQMLIRKRNGATYFCSFLQVIPRSLLEAVHSSQLRFYSFYLKQKIFLCFWKQDWSVNFEPLFTNNHFKVQMNAILILSFRPPAFQCQYMGLKSTLYIICGFRFNLNWSHSIKGLLPGKIFCMVAIHYEYLEIFQTGFSHYFFHFHRALHCKSLVV